MRKKISSHISFPDQLDLSPYMTKTTFNADINQYSLFAVISHFGSSVETGHYMCYVKLQYHNRWFRCDDHVVCEVTAEEVFKSEWSVQTYSLVILQWNSRLFSFRFSYLLFYQRLSEDYPS